MSYITVRHNEDDILTLTPQIGEVGAKNRFNASRREIAFTLDGKPALGTAFEVDLAHAGLVDVDYDTEDLLPGLAQSINYDAAHDPEWVDRMTTILRRKMRNMMGLGLAPTTAYARVLAEGLANRRTVH